MLRRLLILFALVFALRVAFLTQPIQGDDIYYLEGARYAQTDPAHPHHAQYLFQGRMVDMRGHPHPPLNAWALAAVLAALGTVKEVPFHVAYLFFSWVAVCAMYLLARRHTQRPMLATALFAAVPAFLVNGNSLESDLPFLAFWLLGMAFFFEAVETHDSRWLLASAVPFTLAGLTAYQSIFAIPILWILVSRRRPTWWLAYMIALTPLFALGAYNVFEAVGGKPLPLSVTAGYFKEYGLQQLAKKIRNAEALTGHLGWMLCPALVIYAFRSKWMLLALLWAFIDWNPLYLVGVAAAIGLLTADTRRFAWWPQIFFAGALAIFFAGSARYLLPIAAPLVLITVQRLEHKPMFLYAGLAANLALGFGLAFSNYQHWQGYKDFAARHAADFASTRVWVNGEWGMRYYAGIRGGLPVTLGQAYRPGDMILSSELALPVPITVGGGQIVEVDRAEIQSIFPFRLIGLFSRSGYSDASAGVRPFDLKRAPIDRITLSRIVERKPTLSYVPMGAAESVQHIVSGAYQIEDNKYRWVGKEFRLILKSPRERADAVAVLYIPDIAPARRFTLAINGKTVTERTFDKPGLYTLEAKDIPVGLDDVLLTLTCDKSFTAPGDTRELAFILQEAGLR